MLNDIYQNLDPVAFAVGPFAVRWYGLAYLAGFLCAGLVMWNVAKRWKVRIDADSLLTVVFCAIVGIILGGRLGYVLVYGDGYYLQHPEEDLGLQPRWHELPRRVGGGASGWHRGGEDRPASRT